MSEFYYNSAPFDGTTLHSSIFLAGPSPRSADITSWRGEAVRLLRDTLCYAGDVIIPEAAPGTSLPREYEEMVEWEEEGLERADIIVFYIARRMDGMPGLTTNDEWGCWKHSGKVVLGAPPEAERVRYQQHYARKLGIPQFDSLHATLRAAVELCGEGARRCDGEALVPLHVWRTPTFHVWNEARRAAGSQLLGARVEWTWRVGVGQCVFFWALHVSLAIASEGGRRKSNEVVLSRPDTSATVLYHVSAGHAALAQRMRLVLVREFRSNCLASDGKVTELPGGSHGDFAAAAVDPAQVAADEVREETGLAVTCDRLVPLAVRQNSGTASAHRTWLFRAQLTDEEMERVQQAAATGALYGIEEETERIALVVLSVAELLAKASEGGVDWATVGMVLAAMHAVGDD